MVIEKKLNKVNKKINVLAADVSLKHCETADDARKRRKLERKRFKLERKLAVTNLYALAIGYNAEFFQINSAFDQTLDEFGNEQVAVRVTHPVSKRELHVVVFTKGNMNAKVDSVESDLVMGSNVLVRVSITDKGRLVHNRSVLLQDKKVYIDELLLSSNPLLWDVYSLPEEDRKAFEAVKAALTSYLEAITPCTVRGLRDEDDDE
jgi:hypothetical protein